MSTTCLAHDIESVKTETTKTIKSYEHDVNELLDSINEYKSMFENLIEKLTVLNGKLKNSVCEYDQVSEVIKVARGLIGSLRKLIAKAKSSKLYSGYKTALKALSDTVSDFEEYIQDFKFRHDQKAQEHLQKLFNGFSFSI